MLLSVQHWPAPSHHLDCLLRSVLAQSSRCPARSQTFLFSITSSRLALIACFVNALHELGFCFLSGDSVLPFGHYFLSLILHELVSGIQSPSEIHWVIFLLWWHLEHTRKRQYRSSSWYREPMLWYETNDMKFTSGWGLNSIRNLF